MANEMKSLTVGGKTYDLAQGLTIIDCQESHGSDNCTSIITNARAIMDALVDMADNNNYKYIINFTSEDACEYGLFIPEKYISREEDGDIITIQFDRQTYDYLTNNISIVSVPINLVFRNDARTFTYHKEQVGYDDLDNDGNLIFKEEIS